MQNAPEQSSEQKGQAYRRMIIGGICGGIITYALGYGWAAYNDNLNPVAGVGLLLVTSFGIVVGALLSLMSKRWK